MDESNDTQRFFGAETLHPLLERSAMPLWVSDWRGVDEFLVAGSVFNVEDLEGALDQDPEFAAKAWERVLRLAANPAALRFLGVTDFDEFQALTGSADHRRDLALASRTIRAYLLGDAHYDLRTELIAPTGERRQVWATWVIAPQFRQTPFALTSLVDRTAEHESLRALRASEARYRRVVEDQTEFVVRYLPGGVRTFVNDAYCRYFGPREQLLGTSFLDAVDVEFRPEIERKIASLQPGGDALTEVHRVVGSDGQTGWQEWVDRAVPSADGGVEYQAVGRDVSKRVEAERALRIALDEVRELRDRLAIENTYLREEIRDARPHHGRIVGDSAHLRELRELLGSVAATDASVLILGETGTGKELVARELHERSARAQRAMVAINCAAISGGLVEAELFGHKKGAFTGAERDRKGRFEVADGSTLFLDEVGELALETQAKLLRVLQEGTFEPVGSVEPVHVDVRIVAATNRDLAAEIEAGRFRADLYYRLNVVPIQLLPLRERREDIRPLAELFLAGYGARHRKRFSGFDTTALALLTEHDWPGNVRELSNAIERAVIISSGPTIGANELAFLRNHDVRQAGDDAEQRPRPSRTRTLEQVQREHIQRMLEQTDWLIGGPGGAAEVLGMSPSTLRSRMKKLGISRPRGRSA